MGLGLATGMFVAPKIADMLGIGTTATNAATSTGALAEEAAWDLGQGATSVGTIASSSAGKGLFGWANSAWDWAKAHPQIAGSIISGGIHAIGGYMQGKAMEKWKNKELALKEKALDLKYSYSPIDLDRIKKISFRPKLQKVFTEYYSEDPTLDLKVKKFTQKAEQDPNYLLGAITSLSHIIKNNGRLNIPQNNTTPTNTMYRNIMTEIYS